MPRRRFCSRFATCVQRPPASPAFGPQPVAIVAAPVVPRAASSPICRRTLPAEEPTAPVVTEDPEHIWSAIQDELRQAVPADMYDVWLAPLKALGLEGDVLVVEAPRELRAWVAERFARVLQASVAAVLGPEVTVDVRSGAAAKRGPGTRTARAGVARLARARARDQPGADLRAVRHRRRQPLRARRRPGGGRAPRPRVQPALRLRTAGRRQDPPAALDRELRPRLRRRPLASATRRSRPSPTSSSPPCSVATWTASRAATATPTSCSSTMCSSSPPRPRPRRSSSTPSTRCTTSAASSC